MIAFDPFRIRTASKKGESTREFSGFIASQLSFSGNGKFIRFRRGSLLSRNLISKTKKELTVALCASVSS